MGFTEKLFRDLVYYPVAAIQAGPVRKYLDLLEESQYQPRSEIGRQQGVRLSALLKHSRELVPFYSERIPPEPPAGYALAWLPDLPFLHKSDLQGFPEELTSTGSVGRLVAKTTGGSTGEPVTVWKTRDAWAWELAATWRGYRWTGVDVGDLQARFWGVPQGTSGRWRSRAIDTVCRRVRLSAFSFSHDDMLRYVDVLEKQRPSYFYGYVSMLTEFARFLAAEGRRLDFAPTSIITTAEVLSSVDRELLNDVFGAPVFNEYGCGELGTIAHECESGSMHLSEENMVVEVYDEDRPCSPGEVGELVVTELNNVGFPMIRYRTGDYGSISGDNCACGRTLRVLEDVQGRAYDFVRNRLGQLFHGEFIMYIFEELRQRGTGIKQFQFIQTDFDAFTVKIVRGSNYDPEGESLIRARIQGQVDPAATISVEYVDRIERERSGKLRLIKGLGV